MQRSTVGSGASSSQREALCSADAPSARLPFTVRKNARQNIVIYVDIKRSARSRPMDRYMSSIMIYYESIDLTY